MKRTLNVVWLGLVVLCGCAVEPEEDSQERAARLCGESCSEQAACLDEEFGNAADCSRECLTGHPADDSPCARAADAYLECIVSLSTCEQHEAWWQALPGYPCEAEDNAVAAACDSSVDPTAAGSEGGSSSSEGGETTGPDDACLDVTLTGEIDTCCCFSESSAGVQLAPACISGDVLCPYFEVDGNSPDDEAAFECALDAIRNRTPGRLRFRTLDEGVTDFEHHIQILGDTAFSYQRGDTDLVHEEFGESGRLLTAEELDSCLVVTGSWPTAASCLRDELIKREQLCAQHESEPDV